MIIPLLNLAGSLAHSATSAKNPSQPAPAASGNSESFARTLGHLQGLHHGLTHALNQPAGTAAPVGNTPTASR